MNTDFFMQALYDITRKLKRIPDDRELSDIWRLIGTRLYSEFKGEQIFSESSNYQEEGLHIGKYLNSIQTVITYKTKRYTLKITTDEEAKIAKVIESVDRSLKVKQSLDSLK